MHITSTKKISEQSLKDLREGEKLSRMFRFLVRKAADNTYSSEITENPFVEESLAKIFVGQAQKDRFMEESPEDRVRILAGMRDDLLKLCIVMRLMSLDNMFSKSVKDFVAENHIM